MHNIEKDPFDYQVLNLTDKFYDDYPNPPYSELLKKSSRPYNCLLIQSHYGYFICIPYRSNINHRNAFKFKKSKRSLRSVSGLDYSKIIIVKNSEYIGTATAVIDKDEYNETRENIDYIKRDAQVYIDEYVAYISGKSDKYNEKSFSRRYGFSSLKYFHKELGIEEL